MVNIQWRRWRTLEVETGQNDFEGVNIGLFLGNSWSLRREVWSDSWVPIVLQTMSAAEVFHGRHEAGTHTQYDTLWSSHVLFNDRMLRCTFMFKTLCLFISAVRPQVTFIITESADMTRAVTNWIRTEHNIKHVLPSLPSLQWLLVEYPVLYKLAVITFKVLTTREPTCLSDLICMVSYLFTPNLL